MKLSMPPGSESQAQGGEQGLAQQGVKGSMISSDLEGPFPGFRLHTPQQVSWDRQNPSPHSWHAAATRQGSLPVLKRVGSDVTHQMCPHLDI